MPVKTRTITINRAYYEKHTEEYCSRAEAQSMEGAYASFLKQLPPNAHILDAGCGSGRDAVAFISRGYRVTGIDASRAMVHVSRRRGVDARELTFQRMKFREEFDGVWACASLLHVPHVEIPEVLRRIAKALKPNGTLYASVKEGMGEAVAEDGRFFSYFSIDEFSDYLTQSGLIEVREVWRDCGPPSMEFPRAWLNFLAQRKP